jgi:hypothetical protein
MNETNIVFGNQLQLLDASGFEVQFASQFCQPELLFARSRDAWYSYADQANWPLAAIEQHYYQ